MELSAKTKTFFATAVSLWDAEFYIKVDDDVHVNLGTKKIKMLHVFYLNSFHPFCFDVLIRFCSYSQDDFIHTPEKASGLCWLHEVRSRPSQKVSKQKNNLRR